MNAPLPSRPEPVAARDRLIVALDLPDASRALALVEELGDAVRFYKVGLQLFLAEGADPFLRTLLDRGKRLFADLKLYDVPRTVAAAVRQLRGRGFTYVTVHGDTAILEAAVEAAGDEVGILAITVLTSLEGSDLADLGLSGDLTALVRRRARVAVAVGCRGVVASGLEAAVLREELGPGPRIVCPGIRPAGAEADDQKRTVDVEQALEAGADHIVMGRPIRNAPSPREAALAVQRRIRSLFPEP